jgi:hypothetical protein
MDSPTLANVDEKKVLYRPPAFYIEGDFMIFDSSYKWVKIESDSNYSANLENIYTEIINKTILDGGMKSEADTLINTGISHYLESENLVRNYHLLVADTPSHRKRSGYAKLKDGKVMVFGGVGSSNDTWVFHLTDTTNIISEINDTNNIFFDHNILLLKNIERLEIYDIMGQLLKEYNNKDDGIIDLNQYSMGMYFLRYYDGKNYITKKIIKY